MRLTYIALLIVILTFQVSAQEVPGIEDLNVDDTLADVQGTADSLPDELPDDVITTETATQLFGYVKWLFSDLSARELVGETLAPILLNLYVLLVIAITFTMLWITIRLAVFAWRFILFIIGWIIRLIELIPFM